MNKEVDSPSINRSASIGLVAIFGSTLLQLSGALMLSPLLLLKLKDAEVSTTVAGLFAATTWLGVLLITPFASLINQRIGRRNSLWVASGLPLLTAFGFLLTENLVVWFLLLLVGSIAAGLRWVTTESYIAEFAPPERLGFFVGMYATMLGLTYVIGPSILAWIGIEGHKALWIVIVLIMLGLIWTILVPRIEASDTHTASIGLQGLMQALMAHPIIMLIGFVGGFFELGLSSILPLVGLHLDMGESSSALLVAVSGLGGTVLGIPSGLLADRSANPVRGRHTIMFALALSLVLSAILVLGLAHSPILAWPIAFIWGAAGGTLYTMTMTDIAAREKGITLVNSTSLLVLSYTLGALVASSTGGALLDFSHAVGFPLVLIAVAFTSLVSIQKARKSLPL